MTEHGKCLNADDRASHRAQSSEHRTAVDLHCGNLYHPDDNGYSAECFEIDAVAWGETYEEAVENLLDVMMGLAEVIVEDAKLYPHLPEPLLPYGQFILSLGNEEKLRKVLGL